VLEKEHELARHQTGRNSGVIHSGIYYKPGSLKARFASEGSRSMVEFCREHDVPYSVCGKVIVATNRLELPMLENLYRRGLENGLQVSRLSREEVREIEPQVECLEGIRVPSTGIVSYRTVCLKYAELLLSRGGEIRADARVESIRYTGGAHTIQTTGGTVEAAFLVNCAGLHSDRTAGKAGLKPDAKIIPFRGEYYELVPEKRHLVKALVYPVPNPTFPFLGVHFTRMIDGSVHAGPNAVLAFKREGYAKTDVNAGDLLETLTFGGFWKLARKHFSEGIKEMWRSAFKQAFVRSLQRLIPSIRSEDLILSEAGVRAQAVTPGGDLVDDFLILRGQNAIHVCNAPSPAATASLEIGRHIIDQIPDLRARTVVGSAVTMASP
jgi:L-2-hydroxyglutarate oxidase